MQFVIPWDILSNFCCNDIDCNDIYPNFGSSPIAFSWFLALRVKLVNSSLDLELNHNGRLDRDISIGSQLDYNWDKVKDISNYNFNLDKNKVNDYLNTDLTVKGLIELIDGISENYVISNSQSESEETIMEVPKADPSLISSST